MDLNEYEDKLNKQYEQRAKVLEKKIKTTYQDVLKEINKEISTIYAKYEKDGILTYAEMQKYDRLSKLKKQINKYIDQAYKMAYKAISEGLELEYIEAYKYTAYSLEMVSKAVIKFDTLTEEIVKKAVNNPITGLTLSDTLNANRAGVIRDINRTITRGFIESKTYGSMAKQIKTILNGDYKKAVVVARTESHRVNEQARNESALVAHNQGIKQVKKWVSMRDSRVRMLHKEMDGVEVSLDKDFKMPDGTTGPCPGSMGSAKHDIHCRCFTRRKIASIEKKTDEDNELFDTTYSEWVKNKKI